MNRRAFGVLALAVLVGCAGHARRPSPSTWASPGATGEPDLTRPLGVVESLLRDGGVTLYLACPGPTDGPPGDLVAQVAAEVGEAFASLGSDPRVIVSSSEACLRFADLAFPGEKATVDPLLADLPRAGSPAPEVVDHGRELLSASVPWGVVAVLMGHRATIAHTTGVEVAVGEGLICAAAGGSFQVLARTMPNDWARIG